MDRFIEIALNTSVNPRKNLKSNMDRFIEKVDKSYELQELI